MMDTRYMSGLRLIFLVVAIVVFGFLNPIKTWGAYIFCPQLPSCEGTAEDDIIWAIPDVLVDGRQGNDIIFGYQWGQNYIFGNIGNDTLIGGKYNDGLYGGPGNDKYDGGSGDDTIHENFEDDIMAGNDNISGNYGNDYISSGWGADRIFGGPGNDVIYTSPHRDFARDLVDCGSGLDYLRSFNTGDGDLAAYCEVITNGDG